MAINKRSDQFLLDAYSGAGGFATGAYLVKHPRESTTKFQTRKDLAVYPNFTRKIVNVFMGFLWKQTPAREIDGDLYNQFSLNADGASTNLDSLLYSFQRLAMIMGTVFIIVDKPTTQGETRANQALPYLAVRQKSQLAAETLNAAGEWDSVTFSELQNDQTVYRTYTRTGWKLSTDKSGTGVIQQGEYSLGRVPVVRLHIEKPIDPTLSSTESWVADIAALNWDLYNSRSEMRELFRSQTFSLLALPVVDDSERARLKDLTISTENALTYNPSGGGKPDYIAPPADPITLYREHVADIVNDIYRIANLEFANQMSGTSAVSAEARAFQFLGTNASLRGMAEQCEVAENEIADLVYAWQGQTFSGSIAYANEFNMTDLAMAIQTAMDAVTLEMGAEFNRTLKKRLAKQILGNDAAPSTMSAIDQEIDAQGDLYGDRLAQQAGL
jgi:hypothetical protein